jgi:F-type H+-transporting ATPase subunit b
MKMIRFSTLTLALILTAMPVVPVSLHAMQAEPAASKTESVKTVETRKSEGDENDVYRHSATVQWIAKTLHVDVEATARTLELINFAIIVLAIGIPLFRGLPKAFKARNERIQKNVAEARTATEQAKARLTVVEQRLSTLDTEISTIRQHVDTEVVRDHERIEQQIVEEKQRIVESAEQEIAQVTAAAQRELKQFAADLALKVAISKLNLSPESDHELISEFARELGKGVQN